MGTPPVNKEPNKEPDKVPPPPDRYSRQERFAPLGVVGQQRLANASVVIVGCGALGTYHAAALARAGVGRLRVIDRDYVEWNNLQRQWLFEESDAEEALPKAVAAARALRRVNSTIEIEPEVADLTPRNAADVSAMRAASPGTKYGVLNQMQRCAP